MRSNFIVRIVRAKSEFAGDVAASALSPDLAGSLGGGGTGCDSGDSDVLLISVTFFAGTILGEAVETLVVFWAGAPGTATSRAVMIPAADFHRLKCVRFI